MALHYRQQQAYGHAERIFDVQFRPGDSSVVASASEDCTIRVWRHDRKAAKYKQVLCCYGHEAEVMRLGWSLDGQLLASGSADNTVRVWQMPEDMSSTGASYRASQVALLEGHPEEVYHCEFVIPGMCVEPQLHASGSQALQARPGQQATGLAHGETAQASSTHQNGGSSSSSHPAVHQVRNGCDNGSTRCDSGAAGMEPAQGQSSHGPGTHLLVASSESLFLWDLEEGVLQQQADAPGTSGSTVPPDAVVQGYKHAYIFAVARQPRPASRGTHVGQMLACACNDGLVRLWALQQGGLQYVGSRQVTPLGPAPVCALTTLCWNSSGTQLVVAAKDGTVCVLDTRKQLKASHSWRLPCAVLTAATLPLSSPLLQAHQQKGAPQEMMLLGCSDGRVMLYPWTQPEPGYVPQEVCVLPAGSGFSVLALSVSPMCDALAVAGSPVMQPPRTQAGTNFTRPGPTNAQPHSLPQVQLTAQGQSMQHVQQTAHAGHTSPVHAQQTAQGHVSQQALRQAGQEAAHGAGAAAGQAAASTGMASDAQVSKHAVAGNGMSADTAGLMSGVMTAAMTAATAGGPGSLAASSGIATGAVSAPSRRRSGRRGTGSSSGTAGPLAALDISVTDLQLQSPVRPAPGVVTAAVHQQDAVQPPPHQAGQSNHPADMVHMQHEEPAAQQRGWDVEGEQRQQHEEEEEEEEGQSCEEDTLQESDEERDVQERAHHGHHDKPISIQDTNLRAPVFLLLPQNR